MQANQLRSGLTESLTADRLYRQMSAWCKSTMNQGGTAYFEMIRPYVTVRAFFCDPDGKRFGVLK